MTAAGHQSLVAAEGIALDRAGNVVVADGFNRRVRVIAVQAGKFYGQAMKAGDIYTVAGGGANNQKTGRTAQSPRKPGSFRRARWLSTAPGISR